MRKYLRNVWTLFCKEMRIIIKDKLSRIILVMPIIAQTVLFGYVATYDLNNIEYAVLDEDHSHASRELLHKFQGNRIFQQTVILQNANGITPVLDEKKARMVIHIGHDFERQLNMGGQAPVQILVDGRNSNVAGTAMGYASTVLETFNSQRQQRTDSQSSDLTVQPRAWFNPNLETRWGILPALIATLSVIQVIVLAGQSVAREKEQGTFDQLLVTPFSPMVIMAGKALPPVLVGIIQSTLVLLVTRYVFHIPFSGSYITMYLGLLVFNSAVVGIGLCISAFSANMQQAMLYAFTLLMPMILLSGFTTPVSAMPDVFQYATYINPVRYGVEFVQKVYLEGAGLGQAGWLLIVPAIMAVITLGWASRLFRSRLN